MASSKIAKGDIIQEELQELIRKRSYIKGSLTRMKTFADNFNVKLQDVAELEFRQEEIPVILKKYDDIQSQIEQIDIGNESVQLEERGVFEESYYYIRSKFQSLIKLNSTSNVESGLNNTNPSGHPAYNPVVRLPPMSLPSFNGELQKWTPFLDSYCALVHLDPNLTDVQRFYYLKSCLTGSAAEVIQTLPTTSDNYSVAFDRLKARYENKTLIIQSHIRSLLDLPKVKEAKAFELRQLHHAFTSQVQSLQALGEPVEYWDAWLVTIILGRLDRATTNEWILRQDPHSLPTYDELETFISNRCIAYETSEISISDNKINDLKLTSDHRKRDTKFNRSLLASNHQGSVHCSVCNESHRIYTCNKFKSLSVPERFDVLRKARICFNCLSSKHMADNCKSSYSCRTCGRKHHSLLHREQNVTLTEADTMKVQLPTSIEEHSDNPIASGSSLHSYSSTSQIILATAQVTVLNRYGLPIVCRAVLDSGSQINFITKKCLKMLKLNPENVLLSIKGIGNASSQNCKRVQVLVSSRITEFSRKIQCCILPVITEALPANSFNFQKCHLPAHVLSQLADPNFNSTGPIDMLIGAEMFFDLLKEDKCSLGANLPIFQNTELGWIAAGRFGSGITSEVSSLFVSLNNTISSLTSELLSNPNKKRNLKFQCNEEQCAYNHFMSTYRRNSDGRFVVQLPKKDIEKLGQSKLMARSRFLNLERKLTRDPVLSAEYSKFMKEYIDMGHMELIAEDHNISPSFYLPHHAVVKEGSLTTKTRVVFDASAKSHTNVSLNDVLMCGPTVQEDLFSILLRFRTHQIALCADVEKMYRQVALDESDSYLQLIYWRFSPEQPLQTYRLQTVTYGEKPASFLATQCIQVLADEVESANPTLARVLRKDFYVDDLMTGADSMEKGERLYKDVTDVLNSAKMPLRKWCSNSSDLLRRISVDCPDPHFVLELGDQDTIKSLGLLWNPSKDKFHFFVKPNSSIQSLTKRILLSDISRVFDPLGFLSPILIKGKIFIQQLWQVKMSWDEPLPINFQLRWKSFYEGLQSVKELTIPRKVIITSSAKIEMHGFCDASQNAYGACIYLRSQNKGGEWESHLLCSKSRLAPLTPTSIPRLELCGAVLLTELAKKVALSFSYDIKNFRFWTDSMVVIAWIRGFPAQWKTYVANRVGQILEDTAPNQWVHVKSEDNPADLITRGVCVSSIINLSLWWNGPQWLTSNEIPHSPYIAAEIPNEILERKQIQFALAATIEENSLLTRYSSWTRLIRISAWILRFAKNAKNRTGASNKIAGPLNVDELRYSACVWYKCAQFVSFRKELDALTNRTAIPNGSKLLCLNPYVDADGLLRVGGRLKWAPINNNQKNPILLPASGQITKLIFEYYHQKQLHCGPQALLAQIRLNYWPLNARNIARRTVHKCVVCFHVKPRFSEPLMAPLPSSRLQITRPFTNTGVDFAGPIAIRSGIRRVTSIKAYIAVFVCFSTRAVHLELVHGLTSGDFLAALRRFMSRRGKCSTIYSDNATNFVGARRELRSYLQSSPEERSVGDVLSEDGVNWRFIPPGSPHFGGMWEAAVKSTKHHLRRVMRNELLTSEQLSTLLAQIEACLNSRPLTPLSTDPSDFEALTPGHFLIGGPLTMPAEPFYSDGKGLINKWTKVQVLKQVFWKRWSSEYLPQMQVRGKWRTLTKSPKIGDLALLRDENLPPMKWKLVRITEEHPGSDGIVRVVTVLSASGNSFRRSITKLCPLPLEA